VGVALDCRIFRPQLSEPHEKTWWHHWTTVRDGAGDIHLMNGNVGGIEWKDAGHNVSAPLARSPLAESGSNVRPTRERRLDITRKVRLLDLRGAVSVLPWRVGRDCGGVGHLRPNPERT